MAHSLAQAIEFVGFEPAENLVSLATEKLYRVFGEAPSDATTRGVVRRTPQGFEGRLQIRSAVGVFVAEVIGDDPLHVVEDLATKVRGQLAQWKKKRDLGQVS